MKRIKITSVILSVAMLCSMLMPSIEVMADEASAPSETQTTESKDKKEPEDTKKPESKETSKSKDDKSAKETEAPKGTEAVKEPETPKETTVPKETSEPKESVKPEAETPKETETKESEQPEETKAPKETESPKESEPTKEPDESKETEVPKETEPTETEMPKESVPQETEEPKETEPEETPTERVPEETDKKAPKSGMASINASITNGILTWNDVECAYTYEVHINDCGDFVDDNSFNLNRTIDRLIKDGDLEKGSPYTICLVALDDDFDEIAVWTESYYYESSASPIDEGEIQNVKISNGIITWNAYPGAVSYSLWISGSWIEYSFTECSFNLNDKIDQWIRKGEIEKSDSYEIEVVAWDSDDATLARVFVEHKYNSSANPNDDYVIKNIKCTNGILTWDAFDGAAEYSIELLDGWYWKSSSNTFNIGDEIDELIRHRDIDKASSYQVEIIARDAEGCHLADSTVTINYESSATPIAIGSIKNAKVSDGILTWDKYDGTNYYCIEIAELNCLSTRENSFQLNHEIDWYIETGDLEKNSSYLIKIIAYDSDSFELAEYSFEYNYNSSASSNIGDLSNVKISKGLLTWDAYAGAEEYSVIIDNLEYGADSSTSFDLNINIYIQILWGKLDKKKSYPVTITARDKDGRKVAVWNGNYTYPTNRSPLDWGEISKVKLRNGVLTWNAYSGASYYQIWISGCDVEPITVCSFDLYKKIEELRKSGDIQEDDSYGVDIAAFDSDCNIIASYSGSFDYSSSVNPDDPAFTNVTIENGILSWNEIDGTNQYSLTVSGYTKLIERNKTSINLNALIDELISNGHILKNSPYSIELRALDSNGGSITSWGDYYTYSSSAELSIDASISEEGILSWTAVESVNCYRLYIFGALCDSLYKIDEKPSLFDLKSEIDNAIRGGLLAKNSPYQIELFAYDSDWNRIASWSGSYLYDSMAEPEGVDAKISSEGILTWTAAEGVPHYQLKVNGLWDRDWYKSDGKPASYDLKSVIDKKIESGYLPKSDSYNISLLALDSDGKCIASWSDSFTYDSSAEPIIFDAKISDEGILTWTSADCVESYDLAIAGVWCCKWNADSGEPTSYNLKSIIDSKIKSGEMKKDSTYTIELRGFDSVNGQIAFWATYFSYESSAEPEIATIDADISAEGILSWNPDYSVHHYEFRVDSFLCRQWYKSDEKPSVYDLNSEIDRVIKLGSVKNNSSYRIELFAVTENWQRIASWSSLFVYDSSAKPIIEVAEISEDGILTWTADNDVSHYGLLIQGIWCGDWYKKDNKPTSFDLKSLIDRKIKGNYIEKRSQYQIELCALDSEKETIGSWFDYYSYESSAVPVKFDIDISPEGIFTCTADEDVHRYGIWISGEWRRNWDDSTGKTISFDLKPEIDSMIKYGWIGKSSTFGIEIRALDSDGEPIASWFGSFTYDSSQEPLSINDANISTDGVLTWTPDKYVTYKLLVSGVELDYWDDKKSEVASFDLKNEIDKAIKAGKIEKNSPYNIKLVIFNANSNVIEPWNSSFSYTALEISGATVTGIVDMTYTGNPLLQSFVVYVNGIQLEQYVDYVPVYSNDIDAGTAKITFRGCGFYTGSIEKTFEIKPADFSYAVVAGIEDKTFVGSEIVQIPVVTFGNKILVDGTDYTISYANNINIGTATITITGKGNFDGSIEKTFKIEAADISLATISGVEDKSYIGTAITQNVVLTFNGNKLSEGTDYSISYSDSTNVGTAKISISGKGNFTGSIEKTFTINAADISTAKVTGVEDKSYTGSAILQSPVVTLDEKVLANDSDYILSYSNNINAGSATLTITGKGNYTGKIELSFEIKTIDISGATVTGIEDKTYSGESITQSFLVNISGKILENDTDYSVSYANNVNAGTATVTIIGKVNYNGKIEKTFIIKAADISTAAVTGIEDRIFTGTAITQTLSVALNGKDLIEGTDYSLSFTDNTSVGTAVVTITGKGNYTGNIEKTFTINPMVVSDAIITGIVDKSYTGLPITQAMVVTLDSKTLIEGIDYTVSYANNIDAGTATVTFDFKGDYTGKIVNSFKINPMGISDALVTGIENKTYIGTEISQTPIVSLGSKTLIAGSDYTVSYANNINAGNATVTISGNGNYTGTIEMTFKIETADISAYACTGVEDKTFTGSAILQTPLVVLNGKSLVDGTDYTVSYENNTFVGTATLTITGKGNYSGSISNQFTISPADISNATVTGIEDKSYTSVAITQAPTVIFNGKTLVDGTDYTVSYKNNVAAGTATVIITGKGNFNGEISNTFKINTVDLKYTEINGIIDKPYSGTNVTQDLVVSLNGNKLVEGTDYAVSYDNNVELGVATVTVTGIGSCSGTVTSTFNIIQAPNTLTVKTGQTTKVKYSKLRKKKQLVSLAKVISLSNSQGKVTYVLSSAKKSKSKKSFKKYFKVNANTGVVSVKKKLKKGTYTIKFVVTAAGNENYKKITKSVTVKIKVK